MELLLKPLSFHPVQSKTIIDKFAAVGILQVVLYVLFCYMEFIKRFWVVRHKNELKI